MEIEAVITAHPAVVEAAVIGVPHETKGTVPVAFVTLQPQAGEAAARQDIAGHVAATMGGYAQPETVYITAALPKTRTGKILRRLLRDLVLHGEPTGDTSAIDDAAALDVVAAAVRG
jgi:acetyl-CoA synthetase